MTIVGLTGGIGMGKSTVAALFRRAHIPVFDADATVHRLQAPGGAALAAIGAAIPGSVVDGVLDRAYLRAAVVGDDVAMRRLEAILHPLVRNAERAFLARVRRSRRPGAVLDIPLLLEAGRLRRVDRVIVVSAPRAVQVARVVRRGTMSRAQVEAIIARQMPDRQKQRLADLVVHTGLSRFHALVPVRRLIAGLYGGGHGKRWDKDRLLGRVLTPVLPRRRIIRHRSLTFCDAQAACRHGPKFM